MLVLNLYNAIGQPQGVCEITKIIKNHFDNSRMLETNVNILIAFNEHDFYWYSYFTVSRVAPYKYF